MLRKILQFKLKLLAKIILKKYQPVVVAITGSIGKTSAKKAIYTVLKNKRRCYFSPKNYNNEIGLPLSVLGVNSAGHSLNSWLKIIFKAWKLIIIKDKNYPQVLILEMGADHPGDIAYLTKIAIPQVGIVTSVNHTHQKYFSNLENIKKEKQTLIQNIRGEKKSGLAILNYDNLLTREMAQRSRVSVLNYGLQEGADLKAEDIVFNFTKGDYELSGLNFKLNYLGSVVPVFMPKIMTEGALYAALAGAAVGLYFDLNLVEIAQALADFSLPPGRMNILSGINHSFIIDDTYNSSPEAAQAALDILGRIKIDEQATKYAVLGDMLELGNYSEEGHRLVGEKVFKSGIKHLIVVGSKSKNIIQGAIQAGLADNYIFHFDRAEEAGHFLHAQIKAGDLILIKGSQGMRMEKVIKNIMAEPEQASKLLVRQEPEWLNK